MEWILATDWELDQELLMHTQKNLYKANMLTWVLANHSAPSLFFSLPYCALLSPLCHLDVSQELENGLKDVHSHFT